jgi:hypothetical protein
MRVCQFRHIRKFTNDSQPTFNPVGGATVRENINTLGLPKGRFPKIDV